MQRTIKLPLIIGDHKDILLRTLATGSKVYNEYTEYGFKNHVWSKSTMHRNLYKMMRSKYPPFPSAFVQSVRDNACESLKSMNSNRQWKTQPTKKEHGSLRYDRRTFSLNFEKKEAYITVMGPKRIAVTYTIPDYYNKEYVQWRVGGMHLVYRKNAQKFYLHVSMEKEAPSKTEGSQILGIDKGLINFLYLSNGTCIQGDMLRDRRAYFLKRRRALQTCGTRSAKRTLRNLSGREKRGVQDFLHCTVNQLLKLPYDIYAIEDLNGIRNQRPKLLRRLLSNWVYNSYDRILMYKAIKVGKTVIQVDPAYTSQKCSACGFVKNANRAGEKFKCRSCQLEIHADYNASLNIAAAAVNRPNWLAKPKASCVETKVLVRHCLSSKVRLSTDVSRGF